MCGGTKKNKLKIGRFKSRRKPRKNIQHRGKSTEFTEAKETNMEREMEERSLKGSNVTLPAGFLLVCGSREKARKGI